MVESSAEAAVTMAKDLSAPADPSLFLRRLKLVSSISSAVLLLTSATAVARTMHYILRRRAGLIGPAHATRLVKFWSVYGFFYAAHTLAVSYLAPFGLTALATLPFALVSVLLSFGSRLPFAVRAYDGPVSALYTTHAPEIEGYLATMREQLARADEATVAIAEHLLQHLAVGGLSGMGRAFTALFSEAAAAEAEAAAVSSAERAGASPPKKPVPRLAESSVAGADGGAGGAGAAGNAAHGGGSRAFFAGAAHERAEAVAEGARGFVRANVKDAHPKPAYDASRALREKFRRRRSCGGSSCAGDDASSEALDDVLGKGFEGEERGEMRRRRR